MLILDLILLCFVIGVFYLGFFLGGKYKTITETVSAAKKYLKSLFD